MRIVSISDTHGLHPTMPNDLPEGDILIHSGDCTNIGEKNDLMKFTSWFVKQPFRMKIFISGNHDWCFERKEPWLVEHLENLKELKCFYLQDSSVSIADSQLSRPVKVYGSPWQPRFYDWAFNADRDKIHVHWEKIPDDTDILITHGPAFGILDQVIGRTEHLGCESLLEHIGRVKPLLHVSGHIHSGNGVVEKNGTVFVNASICTERYKPTQKPIVVDLIEVDGIIKIK